MSVTLIKPTFEHLAAYASALERGWSADNLRHEARLEEREMVEGDPEAFLLAMDDREARAGPIRLPDGSLVPRLPGLHRWIWDGDFAGSIGLRWQPGTPELPPYCLGHIGYGVVPWKRGRGYAKAALALMLPEARYEGLPYVEITTDPDNIASQRVIVANGGVMVERFASGPQYGETEKLRYRINLVPSS
ncbi:MAG: GNAT family N-acetyltransferase [Candidatus Cybelea sp.]